MASGDRSRSVLGSSDEVLDSVAAGGRSKSVLGSSDEVLDIGRESNSVLGSSDETFEFDCSLCIEDGNRRQAKDFCPECKTYLCDSCTDSHGRFPGLRNHRTVSALQNQNTVSTEDTKKVCGLCSADGKKMEARCFCKDCEAWICDDCKKSHEKFRDLQKHTIVSSKVMSHSESTALCGTSAQLDLLSTQTRGQNSIFEVRSKTKPQNTGGYKTIYSLTKRHEAVALSGLLTKPSTDSSTAQLSNINVSSYTTILYKGTKR